ncbi:MAG: hypothetical protein J2P47_15890, partial [Acetobacteraceae bacterium]|nr:hypothetical protein [Acetobacteraceae bacterium]
RCARTPAGLAALAIRCCAQAGRVAKGVFTSGALYSCGVTLLAAKAIGAAGNRAELVSTRRCRYGMMRATAVRDPWRVATE